MSSELHKALARLAGNRHSDGTSSLISMEDRTVLIDGFHDLMLNTRAVPDVPEMERYGFEVKRYATDGFHEKTYFVKKPDGQYVFHSRAVAVIAAKDAEIKKQHDGGHESFKIAIGWQERALAAEAKLSQIEKQEPVTHYIVSDFGGEFDKVKMMPIGRHPLYAAPVASDADLRAENERYKQALETIENPIKHFQKNAEAEGCTLDGGMAYTLSNDADYLKGVARAALNPSETKT